MKQKEKGEKGKEKKNLPSGCEYQDFFSLPLLYVIFS